MEVIPKGDANYYPRAISIYFLYYLLCISVSHIISCQLFANVDEWNIRGQERGWETGPSLPVAIKHPIK